MTDIDTAAIRARYDWGVLIVGNTLCGICDALDEARARIATALDLCERISSSALYKDMRRLAAALRAAQPRQMARAADAEARIVELDVLIGMMRDDNNAVHDTAVHHAVRAERAEAELVASEKWRHDTALERDFEVARRKAAEAERDAYKGQRDDYRKNYERAFARIAAALDMIDDGPDRWLMVKVRRALTGGDHG